VDEAYLDVTEEVEGSFEKAHTVTKSPTGCGLCRCACTMLVCGFLLAR
jgi:hypothetical protein